MKTVAILGADSLGIAAAGLLNPKEMKLIALGDDRKELWNVFEKNGELKDEIEGMPVMPVDLAVYQEPDVILISAVEERRAFELRYQAIRSGFQNDIIFMKDLCGEFSVSGAALRRIAERLDALGVPGAAAELGCYKGDISWQLNVLLPNRKLYLFDTFGGFDSRDVAMEEELKCSKAKIGQFSDAEGEKVLERMANLDNVVLKKGWFPETAFDLEGEQFALVYIDACLYQPTFTGVEFFLPRMSQGGVIIVKGCNDDKYSGVNKALKNLEEKYGAFLMMPLGDLTGTVLIIHP